jgi:hypothetical protein
MPRKRVRITEMRVPLIDPFFFLISVTWRKCLLHDGRYDGGYCPWCAKKPVSELNCVLLLDVLPLLCLFALTCCFMFMEPTPGTRSRSLSLSRGGHAGHRRSLEMSRFRWMRGAKLPGPGANVSLLDHACTIFADRLEYIRRGRRLG